MTVYRFHATPLTPIHVGNGEVLAPEDYLIEKDHLIQFNRAAVLRDMQPETRRQPGLKFQCAPPPRGRPDRYHRR